MASELCLCICAELNYEPKKAKQLAMNTMDYNVVTGLPESRTYLQRNLVHQTAQLNLNLLG